VVAVGVGCRDTLGERLVSVQTVLVDVVSKSNAGKPAVRIVRYNCQQLELVRHDIVVSDRGQ